AAGAASRTATPIAATLTYSLVLSPIVRSSRFFSPVYFYFMCVPAPGGDPRSGPRNDRASAAERRNYPCTVPSPSATAPRTDGDVRLHRFRTQLFTRGCEEFCAGSDQGTWNGVPKQLVALWYRSGATLRCMPHEQCMSKNKPGEFRYENSFPT